MTPQRVLALGAYHLHSDFLNRRREM
jgi:hypothetical protein